jgi:hypothetical protein
MAETSEPLVAEPLVEEVPENDDPTEEQLAAIRERCERAGLAFNSAEADPLDEGTYSIELRSGRDTRKVYLFQRANAKALLDIEFEKFSFLSDFEAICSYSGQSIEALVRPVLSVSTAYLARAFAAVDPLHNSESPVLPEKLIEVSKSTGAGSIAVSFGRPSKEAEALLTGARPTALVLRIAGATFSQHDQATALLETLSRALFLQIDLARDLPFTLVPTRRVRLRRRRPANAAPPAIVFPEHEYDPAPAALYFYGRGAARMPLLQFLAFYQAIEFYFPTYAQASARRRIKNLLKDPTFRADRDADVTRILTSLDPAGRRAFGDERGQLHATILECVDAQELRDFLEAEEGIKQFFSTKTKGLTDVRLPLNTVGADLRQAAAERIYDIRCKIVHTKGTGEEVELLLPFSKEAAMLGYDIELVQFIARKVLVAASSTLAAV